MNVIRIRLSTPVKLQVSAAALLAAFLVWEAWMDGLPTKHPCQPRPMPNDKSVTAFIDTSHIVSRR